MLRGLFYRLVGPTTVHLEYEFYLLCSLFLLTVSSLQGLYKDAFGTKRGDYIFLTFQCIWLSKHLLLRIICIWDPSTSRSPTLRGFCSHFVTCYLTGGQVFDRPTNKAMARQIGTDHTGGRHHHQGGGGSGSSSSINALSNINSNNILSSLPPTLAYLVQIFKISVWFPLARIVDPPPFALLQRRRLQQQRLLLQQSNKQSSSSRGSSSLNAPELNRSTSSRGSAGGGGGGSGGSGVGGAASSSAVAATTMFRRLLHIMLSYTSIVWNNAPSFQLCLAWSATIFVTYNFFLYDVLQEQPTGPSALYNSGYNTAVKNEEDSMKRSGYYRHTLYVPADIYSLFTLNVQFILLLSLVYFSRLILPIPDQIAGGNILKDARQEAKAAPKQTSSFSSSSAYSGSGGSSSGSHSGSASGVGFLTSLASKWFYPIYYSGTSTSSSSSSKRSSFDHHYHSHHYTNSAEIAWTEKSRPIVTESRWRVHALVLSIRLVDIWLSCGILPRTNSACYVMGHCPTTTRDASMADMAHYLYPIGITKALRDDVGYNPASAAAGTTSGIFAPSSTSGSGGGNLNNGWMTWIGSWMTSWWWSSPIAETLMGKTQIQDSFSAIWITIDLIIIPLVLLCSQALLLNRSYLAIASYFSTEWTWIGPERSHNHHSNSTISSSSRSAGSIQQQQQQHQQAANATAWDPRRKYKKDDVVIYGKNLFRAAFDQPEGRPCDETAAMPLILRIFGLPFFLFSAILTGGAILLQHINGEGGHDGRKKTRSSSSSSGSSTTTTGFTRSANGFLQNVLRNELGHPATSDVICMGSVLLLVLTVIHLLTWLWFTMWNLSNSDGLFCAVAANMIACYAVVSVGSTKYNELNQLNREILAAAR